MNKQDARRLEPAAQFELRKQTISAWMRGQNRGQICEEIGLSYPAVCKIIQRYLMNEAQGLSALAPMKRGRRYGDDRALSMEQELLIQRLMYEKRPEQMDIDAALWSRTALIELIARECQVRLSVRGVGDYLRRWGFRTPKPIRYSGDYYAEPLNKWLRDGYMVLTA
jgi:transposase